MHPFGITSLSWLLGLVFSLGIGHYIVSRFGLYLANRIEATAIEKKWERPEENTAAWPGVRVFPAMIGLVERAFFTVLVGLSISGAAGIAGPYLIAKMAASWSKLKDPTPFVHMHGFRGLMLSLVSIGIGIVGGWIAQGALVEGAIKCFSGVN